MSIILLPFIKNFREVVCALEGGYDLDVTSKGAQACIEELLGICPKVRCVAPIWR